MIQEITFDTDMEFVLPSTVPGIITGFIVDGTSFDVPQGSTSSGGFTYGFVS